MASETPVQYISTSGNSYNYEADPVAAMTSYAKLMHLHTKKQMDAAKRASRRRSGDSTSDAQASFPKQGSIDSNTSTTNSRMSF